MSRTPIALDEAPSAGHVDCIPRVAESVSLKADAWLVAGRLAVAFDDHTVKAGVAVEQVAEVN